MPAEPITKNPKAARSPSSASKPAAETRANKKPRPRRILLVDDDASVRDSLENALVLEGFQVVQAADGQQGLDLLERTRCDVILLDLNMPRLSGWDTYERLVSKYPLIPIILITARPNQLFLAASAGVGALLEKPLDIPVLLKAIRKLLNEDAETRFARLAGRTSEFIYSAGELAK